MTFLDKKKIKKKYTTNFLEAQFGKTITGAGINDNNTSFEMDGDNIEDYDDIIKLMNMPNPINENGVIVAKGLRGRALDVAIDKYVESFKK